MVINVIGLGYIGLPTALMLAANNNKVVGTDFNEKLVTKLKNEELTFEEKDLDKLFKLALSKEITFTTEYISTNIYIITVPTPYDKENKKIDPSYIISAVNSVLKVCKKNTLLVIESTVSPGTIDKYVRPIIDNSIFSLDKDIHLIHAPERILPGNMIHELKYNSRTIGADNIEQEEKIKKIYETFCESEITITDIKTAEMSKVIENTFRDVNIAFANELAKICKYDNMDVYEIIKVANMHPRVNILNPGPGVGGHCISVDPWFLVGDYPELTNIISTARHVNDSMPDYILERISELMDKYKISDLSKIGIYGLTYKQDVDDTRESPSLQLLESMKKHLASPLKSFDPMIKDKIIENQFLDFDEFLESIEFIVVMVGHSHIKENLCKISKKLIFDTQNVVPNAIKL